MTLLFPGDRVVFTGTLTRDRNDWITGIVSTGLTTGGISKATPVVVAADPDSLSGKTGPSAIVTLEHLAVLARPDRPAVGDSGRW